MAKSLPRSPKKNKQRLAEDEFAALKWCRSRGLYILFMGGKGKRAWTVYSKTSGHELGTYTPDNNRVQIGRAKSFANSWQEAMAQMTTHRFPQN